MRLSHVVGRVAVAAGACVLVLAGPAAAFNRDRLTVTANGASKKSYPAFTGSYVGQQTETAGDESGDPTPDLCSDTGAFNTGCDVVPVHLVRPDIPKTDDWLVTLKVTWPSSATAEDLDVFLYDDGQYSGQKTATGGKVYTKLARSATASQPEQFKLISPDVFDLNLVIAHFSGVSQGYSVSGTISTEHLDSPFEVLSDSKPPTNDDAVVTKEETPPPPVDYSAGPGDVGGPAVDVAPPSALPEVAVLPDVDLDAPAAPIEDRFSADALRSASALTRQAPAKPVPAPLVVFWFVIVPVGLLGGAYVVAARRNRSAFSFD